MEISSKHDVMRVPNKLTNLSCHHNVSGGENNFIDSKRRHLNGLITILI